MSTTAKPQTYMARDQFGNWFHDLGPVPRKALLERLGRTKASPMYRAMDSGDKATNKALSGAYKYMAFQTFCIPVQGVDDADAETPPPSRASSGEAKRAAHASAKAPKVEPFELCEEAVSAIQQAKDDDALKLVGHRIAESKFQGEDHKVVTNAWRQRKSELKPKQEV